MGVGGQHHPSAAFTPWERKGTYCTGGWVGPRAGLDNCGKSLPTGIFFCKMIHLFSSDLTIQTYMIKMHLACQNYHKRHVHFLLHELMCMDYVFLAGSRAWGHATCTVDCNLSGDCSFSVGLVMPWRRYRWIPGEVTPTCDAPGACGSSAMREGLEC